MKEILKKSMKIKSGTGLLMIVIVISGCILTLERLPTTDVPIDDVSEIENAEIVQNAGNVIENV